MPQTAPALWMMLLGVVFFIILLMMSVIFSSKNNLTMKNMKNPYSNKNHNWTW